MGEPLQPWQGEVWRRGARLGLAWLGVFAAVTVVMFLVLGITGWSGALRALCAMGVGPVIGMVMIVGWWMVWRPNLGIGLAAQDGGEKANRDGPVEQ